MFSPWAFYKRLPVLVSWAPNWVAAVARSCNVLVFLCRTAIRVNTWSVIYGPCSWVIVTIISWLLYKHLLTHKSESISFVWQKQKEKQGIGNFIDKQQISGKPEKGNQAFWTSHSCLNNLVMLPTLRWLSKSPGKRQELVQILNHFLGLISSAHSIHHSFPTTFFPKVCATAPVFVRLIVYMAIRQNVMVSLHNAGAYIALVIILSLSLFLSCKMLGFVEITCKCCSVAWTEWITKWE